ncbi:MAG: hypothetical protein JNN08_03500 [Bryobacterales bacterium]|nr:hypothetical protein [Bryobacterales bacterium]
MELTELQKHIRTLATLAETDAPVISCYLNLEAGQPVYHSALEERKHLFRKSVTGPDRETVDAALARVAAFIESGIHPSSKGAAIFVREGDMPFLMALSFHVPLPTWLTVNSTPNIYHLVELKDTYDRYVVMFATEASVRILAVNLGSVTEQVWKDRPELRERVGREWTKDHYQRHREERTNQFINEEIRVLDQLMSARGYGHLILAGSPRITARIAKALPKHLEKRLVDIVHASGGDRVSDVVAATLLSFVEQEERESVAVVERLQRAVLSNGLAVIGTGASAKALQDGQVDVLVLAKSYAPDPGWMCCSCEAKGLEPVTPDKCPRCGDSEFLHVDVKEELVRWAEQGRCKIEVVNHSDVLMQLGGVGCLLRYLEPERFHSRAA